MNKESTVTFSKGELVGIGVCSHCNIINKIRTSDVFVENKGKCYSCGAEITIQKMYR